MNEHGKGILANWDATDEEVAEAMVHAIDKALLAHKRAGVPIAIWDEEAKRVVLVPPEEIEVPEDATEPQELGDSVVEPTSTHQRIGS